MALYEKKWWKNIFAKPKHNQKVDLLNSIEAIDSFLKEFDENKKRLQKNLNELQNLEQEREVAQSGALHINIETQIKVLDKLLKDYDDFQNDTGINGLRLRIVAKEILKLAEKVGLKDLVNEKKKDFLWKNL
jgi:hypothetical protein